jgi:hypothetical protein
MKKESSLLPVERITERIFFIRGRKVMLSTDLAEIYGIPPKVLMQAVRRNAERFPSDFMFPLDNKEFATLKSQFVTSKLYPVEHEQLDEIQVEQRGGIRKIPFAFTEQGVAMLSSVLKSRQAVQMNIAIMRAFVRLRQVLQSHDKLSQQLRDLESRVGDHDEQIRAIFEAIRQLIAAPEPEPKKIGFHVRERRVRYTTAAR